MKLIRFFLLPVLGAMPLAMAAQTTPAPSLPATGSLEPFVAKYSVSWKSINAGTSELQLEKRPDGRYVYTSRSNARGLYKLIFSEEIVQTSTVEIGSGGVRPLSYRGDDGSDDTDKDVNLTFDWTAGLITGVAENRAVHMELPAGVQDPMSIQLALMSDLRANRPIAAYPMADKDRTKTYVYTYEGKQRIDTALGPLDTVVYSSHRQDSTRRIIRMWHAPSLGYIPVKAERIRDGKREIQMEIQSLQRSGAAQ